MAYERKQYALAIQLLEKEYDQTTDKALQARKSFLLAKSNDILQKSDEALDWYEKAYKLKYRPNSDTDLAYALKKNEKYEEAAVLFTEIFKKTKDNKYRREVELCKDAVAQLSDPDNFRLEKFSSNSKYADYSPRIFENEFIVFTSDRGGDSKGDEYKWTGNSYSDLYIANSRGRNASQFDATINTDANEGAACFSKDYSEIFFTRCVSENQRDQFCKIYYSQRPNGFWLEPEALPFFNEKTNYGQPTLIENDSVLIFTVTQEGQTTSDLYYSEKVDGGWSEAAIMPSSINTSGDEKFPTSYGDTLFFSSDTHAGYGGYDIFKTYLKANGTWSQPENLGIPVNSGADDFGLVIHPGFKANAGIEMQGYFTSSRNTGFNDDIFFFTKFPEDADENTIADDPTEEEEKIYLINIAARVVEVQHENDDPNGKIIGKIPLADSDIQITFEGGSATVKTNKQGRFLQQIEADKNYAIKASKSDFLANAVEVSSYFENLTSDTTINIEIPLERIVYDKEIVLDNIYYDFEKWDIREDARPTLDTLADLLRLNPGLKIQLSSHTDCRGTSQLNEDLSQKRAQSAVDYIASKGIVLNRLRAKGYGESLPSIPCPCDSCTEEQHQANRRTTFKILK